MIILIGLAISLVVFLVLFWFFSSTKHLKPSLPPQQLNKAFTISSKDIENIAGDNVLTTQLDLARAYIETDRKSLAKSILTNVLVQGSADQKQEAKRLLANLQMLF